MRGHQIVLVLTQPDRPAGRGMKLQPSPVKQLALAHGLPLYQPDRLRDPSSHGPIRDAVPDVMVVAAYGLILPQAVLDIPSRGCLNIHASLLPRWRGAAPIQRAIEAGDSATGITIMRMEAGLDTGPMLLVEPVQIGPDDTAGSLHDRLADVGARLIVTALAQSGRLTEVIQPTEGVTYARKIEKAESIVDWHRAANDIDRQIRAFNPMPGAVATLHGAPIKIWRSAVVSGQGRPGQILATGTMGIDVACGAGSLRLFELQRAGGKRLPATEFLAGFPLAAGACFDIAGD
jgi:methionyl-tRNA formyltransferase